MNDGCDFLFRIHFILFLGGGHKMQITFLLNNETAHAKPIEKAILCVR